MKKKKNKKIFIAPVLITICLLIGEIVINQTFYHGIAFLSGFMTCVLTFQITKITVERATGPFCDNPKRLFVSVNLSKLLIYGIVIFFFGYLNIYCAITTTLGMMCFKGCLYVIYLVVIPKKDKRLALSDLKITSQMQEKLLKNNITVYMLTQMKLEQILLILTIEEVEILKKALKEYQLYYKDQLEVLEDVE